LNNTSAVSSLMTAGQQLGQTLVQLRSPDAQAIAKVAASPVRPSASAVLEAQPMRDAMVAAQEQIQAFVRDMDRDLSFVFDEASGHMIVSVIDPQSGQVIRRLPGEELLRLASSFAQMGNVLVDQKA
jgi:flagellar protein FlaG